MPHNWRAPDPGNTDYDSIDGDALKNSTENPEKASISLSIMDI